MARRRSPPKACHAWQGLVCNMASSSAVSARSTMKSGQLDMAGARRVKRADKLGEEANWRPRNWPRKDGPALRWAPANFVRMPVLPRDRAVRDDARQLLPLRQHRLLVSFLHREHLCPVFAPATRNAKRIPVKEHLRDRRAMRADRNRKHVGCSCSATSGAAPRDNSRSSRVIQRAAANVGRTRRGWRGIPTAESG